MKERRRWGRVKVPDNKLTCRIIEPKDLASSTEFLINDINPGGISFFCDHKIEEKREIKIQINFPFAYPQEPIGVWGRVLYSRKIHEIEKNLIGLAFIRKK